MKKNSKLFCLICRSEIPTERLLRRPAVTCGNPNCSRELKKRRQAQLDLVKCRFCGTPSTPQERREFNAWRKARGDKKKRGPKPKYPVPDPRQMSITDQITVH